MRPALWILVATVTTFSIQITHSATINLSKSALCDIALRGSIEAGDVARLEEAHRKAAIANQSTNRQRLCLHSPGGSYDEALQLIKWLMEAGNVATVVDQGDECYSACALVFMFGNNNEGDGLTSPNRKIHFAAKLGFHTPHIKPAVDSKQSDLSAKAYRSGVKAIGRLMEIDWDDWFPKTLLIETLKKEPEEFLFVDTIGKAAAWNIDVIGLDIPRPVTQAMLEQACLNSTRGSTNKWMARWWGAGESVTGQREKITSSTQPVPMQTKRHRAVFKGFGSEDSYVCVADIYDAGKRGLLLDVNWRKRQSV